MQQLPAENKFRNCFICGPDEVFVSGDYASQELVTIAFGSKDPVWLSALERGEDLHSICAEKVYGPIWTNASEPGCLYVSDKQKCSCKEHKRLRDNVKSVNFG